MLPREMSAPSVRCGVRYVKETRWVPAGTRTPRTAMLAGELELGDALGPVPLERVVDPEDVARGEELLGEGRPMEVE